jgi:hypothetical protein
MAGRVVTSSRYNVRGTDMNRRWAMAIPLAFVVGCGFPAAKVEEAKGHVKAALDKWQAGGKPDELKAQPTPVEFHEAIWNAGEKLVSFELGAAKYIDSAQAVRCEVKLTVRNKRGKERTEIALYDVTLGPPVKVVNNVMP